MMEQNLSIKARAENRRWFSLPDEILENIVSRLDLPLYTDIAFSDTVFKIHILNGYPGLWSVLENLFTIFCSHFITNFSLVLHYTFYFKPCSSTILASWARHLRSRNVQHLFLQSFGDTPSMRHELYYPPTIFHIHSLVSLDIDSCIDENFTLLVRNPITLPNLKNLRLRLIHCYRNLELILRYCPSLEYLRLIIEDEQPNLGKNSPILIAGKNLKQLILHLESDSIIEVTIDAPKLEEFDYNSDTFISMRMFDSISHVKSLEILTGSRVRLYQSRPKTIIFPNLGCLRLYTHYSYDDSNKVFRAIVSMLQCCPNLDVLKLYIDAKNMIWIREGKFAPIIEHVKLLTLSTGGSVYFNKHMSKLVTYLLRSSAVLEKLIIYGHDNTGSDNESAKARFRRTLLECPKASSSCQVEFLGGYKLD